MPHEKKPGRRYDLNLEIRRREATFFSEADAVVGLTQLPLESGGAVLPVLFFYMGMVCWLFRDRIPLNGFAAAGALVVMVASVPLKIYPAAVCVTYPYVLLYLGFGTPKKASFVGRKLELSYGIYLTGFPVQQVLIHCFPEMGAAVNFLLAACLSAALSVPITLLDRRIAKRFGKA